MPNIKLIIFSISLLFSSLAITEDLLSLYRFAVNADPTLQIAYHEYKAALEVIPQARANFLPVISASANVKGNSSTNPALKKYNTQNYQLTITQPVFKFVDWSQYSQATNQVKAAHSTYAAQEQDLIIRLTEQYFDILKAKDNLNLAKAERIAFARHLEQTKQRFQVGLIAITDVHEAQARHDSAFAEEISSRNELSNQYEELREIVGVGINQIKNLRSDLKLESPKPNSIEHWVETAIAQNLDLQAARFNLSVSKQQITREGLAHLPTVQVDGNIARTKSTPPTSNRNTLRDIGVTLTVPLFSGGSIISKTKEARSNYNATSQDFEKLLRKTDSDTRQAFRGVLTQISQIKALNQTVISNQSALKATEAAFQVGTRTIVDVLNAQSDLLTAKKNYAKARYDYILERLKLKQAAGILKPIDIDYINKWLK